MPARANIRDPDVAAFTETHRARFYAKVAPSDANGCRMWTACCTKDGTPRVRINGVGYQAHRVAWLLAHEGVALAGRLLSRSCKRAGCCEPSHGVPLTEAAPGVIRQRWRARHPERATEMNRAISRRYAARHPDRCKTREALRRDRVSKASLPDAGGTNYWKRSGTAARTAGATTGRSPSTT